jgi:hypothetical protein
MSTNCLSKTIKLEPKQYEAAHLKLIQETKTNDLSVLKHFTSHSLAEQSSAALMNRIDSKYLLPISEFSHLMHELSNNYSILSSGGNRIFNYQTTYFDNKERRFYLDHHNGKLNRYKVRFRRYVESDMGYMEIKFKNNKKRTIKQRIPMDCVLPNQLKVNAFIKEILGYTDEFETALFVNYQRITLLNNISQERITIDLNLSFRNAADQVQSIQDKVFIIEIKQDVKSLSSPCRKRLKILGYNDLNFSKYCIGSVLTKNSQRDKKIIKYNRFKNVLRQLDKLNSLH